PNPRQRVSTPAKRYSGYGFDKRMLGATPFLLATRASDLDAMRVLAGAGAHGNLGRDDGATPGVAAAGRQVRGARFAEVRIVEAITTAIELGSSVNARNRDGDTALHLAATRRLDTVVRFLADHGAVVNAKNTKGQTALAATLAPVPPARGAGQ